MNLAKLLSIIRGDLIEEWIERQQQKLAARGLDWLPKAALVIVTLAILVAIVAYGASLRP
ncbi:MAG: hypothetical protein A3C30_02760 [Candidatus Levybacteria bacterium RIFCSPHIGHO2_02_FULL_40_18]|nr:MAG: hypothetical protein A2869_05220 [Candidatus Levybacteria bacterium RIFCSPHIGHO2_01_FULL_40_58]OGH26897.1 MAG: hypothetical protein A3C30_02760 [Candidatus Levybacteria bacterium RIFCSPHIGHO2_02_FULL_40_18]OGH32019.1 MAG: hypothetical protein A3E43_03740 [Candidatus Levybacteria bacterium RIFCSPHIGHO2_12_FULL_40_31]OGH40859.1 MAG: hypothetical protein A2894_04660 [Candidatus Levybacteria bacterium RIFCSPLOWO2_01_FULL_40_64]OGH49622.1 MAG: hypothetical protein A3I54_04930 [Candidatus Lev